MPAPEASWVHRHFRAAAASLLIVLFATAVLSVRGDSQTWDEAFELASGYVYLTTGEYRIAVESPPFPRILAALPLLAMRATPKPVDPPRSRFNDVGQGEDFVYRNRLPAETVLMTGRLVMIGVLLALALAMTLWTRRHFGSEAALLVLAVTAFEPTLLGLGRYIKGDVTVTLLAFLAVIAWASYLESRKTSALIGAGAACGLAIASKITAIFLGPAFVALALVAWWRKGRGFPWFRTALGGLAALALALGIAVALYAPHIPELWTNFWQHPLVKGVNFAIAHNQRGHPGYLLGEYSDTGWWYYFPVAFAVKTPVALLAGLVVALVLGALWLVRRRTPLRAIPLAWFTLLIPIAAYLPVALTGRLALGIRHLLPIYPFLLILIAVAFATGLRRARTAACVTLAATLAVESLWVYPHYLAFFNALVGGPKNGPRRLLDSNIDWGQDALRLKSYLTRNGVQQSCNFYFGSAPFWHYKIDGPSVPDLPDAASLEKLDCVVTVSVTPLYGVYVPREKFAALRALEPTARIGYSIYVYDLRKKK